ncbi:hypothetical protein EYR41_008743 [Orbilia oligospora]|uniref:Uncharacterized protein n=1 Tax=Orbilia oligospora TaxID=2813651 RepID=A0A7C8TRI2_ORBOL|nr:hypothetical protein TWF751_002311 [Orbilia oligospora]TGJ67169.1 hypothetical protein EYR41_008743 [Orbilia oligospora]
MSEAEGTELTGDRPGTHNTMTCRPPSVPRPKLSRTQNLGTAQVQMAFNDEYWLRKTENWEGKAVMANILTLIQSICEEVLEEYEGRMSKTFPSYLRQVGPIKRAMYGKFLELLQTSSMEEEDRSLIFEMMEATDFRDKDLRGSQWLFEYCIRRTTENRSSRAKTRDPKAKKRHRGVVYFQGTGNIQGTSESTGHNFL